MSDHNIELTKWEVEQEDDETFVAERTQRVVIRGAASSAEAKLALLKSYGGQVDLRGAHKQKGGEELRELAEAMRQ